MPNSPVIHVGLCNLAAVVLLLIPLAVAFPTRRVDVPKPCSIFPVPSLFPFRISPKQQGVWPLWYQSSGGDDETSVIATTPTASSTTSQTSIVATSYDPTTASTTTRRSSSKKIIRFLPNKKNKESVSTPGKNTALIPLSPNPLLFVSSSPLLTPQECEIVSEWCRRVEKRGESIEDKLRNIENIKNPQKEADDDRKGLFVMKRLQRLVHHSVLGMGSRNSKESNVAVMDDYVVPRFLHYESTEGRTRQECNDHWNSVTVDQLIPDGLHVDTNNNKHFRHWTILVYLDSTESPSMGGATTFPLAERYHNNSIPIMNLNSACPIPYAGSPSTMGLEEESSQASSVGTTKAATDLIYKENVQHTRIAKENAHVMELGKHIEDAALRLYQEEAHAQLQGDKLQSTSSSIDTSKLTQGIRIMPRQGHICLFSGVNHDGYPNPFSFHAGEAILAKGASKNVLTFFYEVPTNLFSSRAEFGEQVRKREQAFLEFHGISL